MELNYDVILLLQHMLYIYYIHDDIIKWWNVAFHCYMWFINIWVHHVITVRDLFKPTHISHEDEAKQPDKDSSLSYDLVFEIS